MLASGRSVLCLLLILAAALAGCLGDEETPAGGSDTGDDVGGDGTGTGTGGDGTPGTPDDVDLGEPPIAAFAVSPEADLEAGANVTFNASASSDPEGTNLTFSWDFGDNATGEGSDVVHVYEAAGNYTVVLNVTDEEGLSTTTNQTVTILSGGPEAFAETLEGSVPVPHTALVLTPGGSDLATYEQRGAVKDTTYILHEVTDVPTNANEVFFELATSAQNLQYVVFDGDGNQLGLRDFPTGKSKLTLNEEDAQHGHYFVFVFSAVSPNAAYTIDVSVA